MESIYLLPADEIDMVVDQHFAHLGTWYLVTWYFLHALRGIELYYIRFPRGTDMVVGDEGEGLVYDSLFTVDDLSLIHI